MGTCACNCWFDSMITSCDLLSPPCQPHKGQYWLLMAGKWKNLPWIFLELLCVPVFCANQARLWGPVISSTGTEVSCECVLLWTPSEQKPTFPREGILLQRKVSTPMYVQPAAPRLGEPVLSLFLSPTGSVSGLIVAPDPPARTSCVSSEQPLYAAGLASACPWVPWGMFCDLLAPHFMGHNSCVCCVPRLAPFGMLQGGHACPTRIA
ncbi:hypothetical protein AAY473_035309 [Plecturocebus cupreus]